MWEAKFRWRALKSPSPPPIPGGIQLPIEGRREKKESKITRRMRDIQNWLRYIANHSSIEERSDSAPSQNILSAFHENISCGGIILVSRTQSKISLERPIRMICG